MLFYSFDKRLLAVKSTSIEKISDISDPIRNYSVICCKKLFRSVKLNTSDLELALIRLDDPQETVRRSMFQWQITSNDDLYSLRTSKPFLMTQNRIVYDTVQKN